MGPQDVGKEISDMGRLCAKIRSLRFPFAGWLFLLPLLLSLLLFLTGCEASGLIRERGDFDSLPALESSAHEREEESMPVRVDQDLYVHVCGAVKKAGLYCLPAGSRAADAIEAAGGFTRKADRNAWNLAQPLEDGMQIYVPQKGETEGQAGIPSGFSDSSSDRGSDSSLSQGGEDRTGKVNINTASEEELMTLKGIGKSRAADIIAYRQTHGGFTRIEDIRNVSGIGDSIFDKIKDKITVS